jgi:hypothetical protein
MKYFVILLLIAYSFSKNATNEGVVLLRSNLTYSGLNATQNFIAGSVFLNLYSGNGTSTQPVYVNVYNSFLVSNSNFTQYMGGHGFNVTDGNGIPHGGNLFIQNHSLNNINDIKENDHVVHEPEHVSLEPLHEQTPQSKSEPSPEPTPESAPEIKPSSALEQTPEPTPPGNAPQPVQEPTLEATPESTSTPTPEPTPEPIPQPTPEPIPELTPEPTPEPTLQPPPEPTPQPTPEPTHKSTSEPNPESINVSSPEPEIKLKEPEPIIINDPTMISPEILKPPFSTPIDIQDISQLVSNANTIKSEKLEQNTQLQNLDSAVSKHNEKILLFDQGIIPTIMKTDKGKFIQAEKLNDHLACIYVDSLEYRHFIMNYEKCKQLDEIYQGVRGLLFLTSEKVNNTIT